MTPKCEDGDQEVNKSSALRIMGDVTLVTSTSIFYIRAVRLLHYSKMADLLGSILNSMEKPPTVGDQESRRKARGTYYAGRIVSRLLLV